MATSYTSRVGGTLSAAAAAAAAAKVALSELYAVDFTAQATQDFRAQGANPTVTIAGKQWIAAQTAAASVFGITNGTGLRLVSSSATVVQLVTPNGNGLSSLVPALDPVASPLPAELWFRMVVNAFPGSGTSCYAVANARSEATGYGLGVGWWQSSGKAPFLLDVQGSAGAAGRAGNLTDDVLVLRLRGSRMEALTGAWASGWPAASALRFRGYLNGTLSGRLSTDGVGAAPSDLRVSPVYVTAGSSAANIDVTVTHFRILGVAP